MSRLKIIASPGLTPWSLRIPIDSPLHDRSYGRAIDDDEKEEDDYFNLGDRVPTLPLDPPTPPTPAVATLSDGKMLISLTVGKVDAGVAVLLTEDKRLIEFPSILLPPTIASGSIVDITVSQNHAAESKSSAAFQSLQSRILQTYGLQSPSAPILRLRNATQTSLVLEWDPLELATADLKSLSLYRNGSKAGAIPRPLEIRSTKISGLSLDTEYNFHLVLRTSGGTFSSEKLVVKTHKMTDLSGITITPGVLPPQLRASLEKAVERIGAKVIEGVRIDTTHFVCTEGRGREWERALEMSIPVVRPEWVEGCEREGRIVGVRGYYLDANPKDRVVGQGAQAAQAAATVGEGSHQSPITQRPRDNPVQQDRPRREREEPVDGGPGPETPALPPTPPPKGYEKAGEQRGEEEDDEEEENGDEDESETDVGAPTPDQSDAQTLASRHQHDDDGASGKGKGKGAAVDDEDGEEGEEEGKMDEVPL